MTNFIFLILAETLAASVTNSGGVYFVPAFSGLYAPYWQTDARGFVYLVLILCGEYKCCDQLFDYILLTVVFHRKSRKTVVVTFMYTFSCFFI